VYSFIGQLEEDEIDKACFQQDGTMAHTAHMSMALLDDMFADRIISTTRSFSAQLFFLGCDKKLSIFEQSPHNS
jgi:hypothetical protein